MAKAKKSSTSEKSRRSVGAGEKTAEKMIHEAREEMIEIAIEIEKKYNEAAAEFTSKIKEIVSDGKKMSKIATDLERRLSDKLEKEETEDITNAERMYGYEVTERMKERGQIPSAEEKEEHYSAFVTPLIEVSSIDGESLSWHGFGEAMSGLRGVVTGTVKELHEVPVPD